LSYQGLAAHRHPLRQTRSKFPCRRDPHRRTLLDQAVSPDPNLVLAAVAVAKNANGSETSAKWKKSAEKTVKKALGHNQDTRVAMAHSYLEPQADGSIRLTKQNLRQGQLKGKPKSWKLEDKIKETREITKNLQRITADLRTLTISI